MFPVNSVKAMRGALVADEHRVISRYSRRVFESYWTDDKDISQDDVMREIVKEVGLDEKEYFDRRSRPPSTRPGSAPTSRS